MGKNNDNYLQLYKPCEPFYKILTGKEPQNYEYCNKISISSVETHAMVVGAVIDDLDKVKEVFHPTRDRLNNPFLKLLMGSKSVKILE
jgi:hypothetical protein